MRPAKNREYTAWEYAAKDGKEACLSVVFTDQHGNPTPQLIKFKGLLPEKEYRVLRDNEVVGRYTGAALMNGGIILPVPKENYDSCQFYASVEQI